MKDKMSDSFEFIRGAARYSDLVYVLSKAKALSENEIAHTSALGVDQGSWVSAEDTSWDSTAITVAKKPSEKLVFVGEDGDVCTFVGGKSSKEEIKPAPKLIRNAKAIDGFAIVCGMLRQVFQRIGEGEWKDISAPFPTEGEEVGFEAIGGYSLNELYAVGWNGEIWEYDGSSWSNQNSPADLILSSVCCAPDGLVYIGGQQGVFIKGRKNVWEMTEWEDDFNFDIWDLCWFNRKLYVATMNNLYTLEENRLVDVSFGETEISTFGCLTEAEGIMWSIGSEDVLSFDGKVWQRYD